MNDDFEDKIRDSSEVFERFPCLQSFPFNEYIIQFEEGDDFESSEIDPIIVSAAGGIVKPEYIHFSFKGPSSRILISFYTYDVTYIIEESAKIRKLDSVRADLDFGLEEDALLDKIDAIKIGERFVKKLGPSLLAGKSFDKILDNLFSTYDIEMDEKRLKQIKSMRRTIKEENFDESELHIIRSFYNLHLHHMKILLGIVIAAKIH